MVAGFFAPMTQTDSITERTLIRRDLAELVQLSWPVVLSRLGIMTMGLTDVMVVSHYSTKEIGYQALGWTPTGVVIMTGAGLLAGVQIVTARHIGEGRPEATGGVLRRGLVYSAWLGAGLAALLYAFGPWALAHIGLEPDLARGAGLVLQVLALSLPFHLISTSQTYFLEALSRPKPATLAMWGCNLINLAVNLILVPGMFGIPAMGAVGASWATVLSRAILCAWLGLYIIGMGDARALGIFKKPIDSRKDAVDQLVVGFGGGASYFVEAGAFSTMNIIAGYLGTMAIAGWTLVLNVTAMIFMIPLGLSAATAVLVGRAYGAKDRAGLVRAGNLGFAVCTAAQVLVAIVILFGAKTIAGLYTPDVALIEIAATGLTIGCLYFAADGLQGVAAQALRARGDVLAPTLTHIFSYAVVMIPLAAFLALRTPLGLWGILTAVIVASALSAGLLLGRFWWKARAL